MYDRRGDYALMLHIYIDYRRACFFAAASGSLEAWQHLLPIAARINWQVHGEGSMDRHMARLCWPALWVAADKRFETLALDIVQQLRRCNGFRRPLPVTADMTPAVAHPQEIADSGGKNGWAHEWDAFEWHLPSIYMCRGVGVCGGRDMKGTEGGCSAMEGLLDLVFARGCRVLAERLVEEGGESLVALEAAAVVPLVASALATGCLGAVSVWVDVGLPYPLQRVLDKACASWRVLLRARRSSTVVGVKEGELVHRTAHHDESTPLVSVYERHTDFLKCLEAVVEAWHLLPVVTATHCNTLQQTATHVEAWHLLPTVTEDDAACGRGGALQHAEAFCFDAPAPLSRYAPDDFGRSRRLDSLPSVLSWYPLPVRTREREIGREKERAVGGGCRSSAEAGAADDAEYGQQTLQRTETHCNYGAYGASTEYRQRYTLPRVEETVEARRGMHNKDATWRAGIETDDFKKTSGDIAKRNDSDSDSEGNVPAPFAFPGPGAYDTDEGRAFMLMRARVAPSFGRGCRFSSRWSLASGKGLEWHALHHELEDQECVLQRCNAGEKEESGNLRTRESEGEPEDMPKDTEEEASPFD